MNLSDRLKGKPRKWNPIWGAGEGGGAVKAGETATDPIDRLDCGHHAARDRLALA